MENEARLVDFLRPVRMATARSRGECASASPRGRDASSKTRLGNARASEAFSAYSLQEEIAEWESEKKFFPLFAGMALVGFYGTYFTVER